MCHLLWEKGTLQYKNTICSSSQKKGKIEEILIILFHLVYLKTKF